MSDVFQSYARAHSNPTAIMSQGESTITIEDTVTQTLSLYGVSTVEIIDSSIKYMRADNIERIHLKNATIGETDFTLREEALIECSRVGQWVSNSYEVPGTPQKHMKITDSTFGFFSVDKNTVYLFENTRIENRTWLQPDFTELKQTFIMGEVKFNAYESSRELVYSSNEYITITRQYEVQVTRGKVPQESAYIEVQTGGGVRWRGYTDEHGSVRFNLTFNRIVEVQFTWGPIITEHDNTTQLLAISIEHGGDVQNRNITFTDAVPIRVDFKTLTNDQRGIVAVTSIIVLIMFTAFSLRKCLRMEP